MASNLLSLGGWYFLPNLVTGWAQSIYYAVWIRAGDPRPQPGTPLYAKHRRRIHVLVILTYLLYTIYEADWELRRAGDFYQDLGVAHDASERTIQSRFRRLTVQYHPDKISSSTDRAAAERFYVHLQLARDTLVDPIKRFSYDRFGPSMLAWRHRHTIWDHVSVGVQQIAGYYIGTAAVLVLFGITGYAQHAPFWRYLAMVSLLVFELYTMTRPDSPIVLTRVVNPLITRLGLRSPYLPFQFLSLARKIVLTVFIAISQIGPLLAQARGPGAAGDASGTVQGQQLDFLDQLGMVLDQESAKLVELELVPFAGDAEAMRDMRNLMREWLLNNAVRNDGQVRDALGRALQRRREGVPAGAVGTR